MEANVYEIKEHRDQVHVFRDRSHAGEVLAGMIRESPGDLQDGIVLAVPAGGVPVGKKISEVLGLPLELSIVRKLQIPGNPEAGFGAMAQDGTVFFNDPVLEELRLTPAQIEEEKKRVLDEMERRNERFRAGRLLPDPAGKRVILADDGLASGYTMLASIHMVKKGGAGEVIVAIPTAPEQSVERVRAESDRVYCVNIRTGPFFAVADAYRTWHDLHDDEVLDILEGLT
jgi:predicted phosphoribosyltransferase